MTLYNISYFASDARLSPAIAPEFHTPPRYFTRMNMLLRARLARTKRLRINITRCGRDSGFLCFMPARPSAAGLRNRLHQFTLMPLAYYLVSMAADSLAARQADNLSAVILYRRWLP